VGQPRTALEFVAHFDPSFSVTAVRETLPLAPVTFPGANFIDLIKPAPLLGRFFLSFSSFSSPAIVALAPLRFITVRHEISVIPRNGICECSTIQARTLSSVGREREREAGESSFHENHVYAHRRGSRLRGELGNTKHVPIKLHYIPRVFAAKGVGAPKSCSNNFPALSAGASRSATRVDCVMRAWYFAVWRISSVRLYSARHVDRDGTRR